MKNKKKRLKTKVFIILLFYYYIPGLFFKDRFAKIILAKYSVLRKMLKQTDQWDELCK